MPVRSPANPDAATMPSILRSSADAPSAGGAAARRSTQEATRIRDAVTSEEEGRGGSPPRLAGERELLADGLEQALVDLAVVDGDGLLVAEADDIFPLHAVLLGKLVRRQVIGHACPLGGVRKLKNPPRRMLGGLSGPAPHVRAPWAIQARSSQTSMTTL